MLTAGVLEVKPLDGELSPTAISPRTHFSMRNGSISTSTGQSASTPIHSRFASISALTSSAGDPRSRPEMSSHTRSSSQLPLLSNLHSSEPLSATGSAGRVSVDVSHIEEPLYNPYEHHLSAQPAALSTSSPLASRAVSEISAPASSRVGTSLELGPNGYPVEKRREFRMEPGKDPLFAANPDTIGSSSSPGSHLEGRPSDSPPAYGT
ncbi:hypothetical protein L226DRAFT_165033 [Lentinus tigrinus ALCF2SS1-7]|uniref:uncharacterized protein n=1 Tax=Lentinus tigrinus ALCF2SS1-7 TaxID=1328758 RepID=UPI001166089D|nr:hypothetical protein L226DRAFT_165033 [Lentinus tigrinus ALCF2SS1-7]